MEKSTLDFKTKQPCRRHSKEDKKKQKREWKERRRQERKKCKKLGRQEVNRESGLPAADDKQTV